jgi:lipopolysaccharide transport system permease protein
MARREITDRYAGQLFGVFWTFVHPLIVILVYVFLFNFVFISKAGSDRVMPIDMTAYILSGIIPWLAFQDAMGKASTVIINNANLVKQVIFSDQYCR